MIPPEPWLLLHWVLCCAGIGAPLALFLITRRVLRARPSPPPPVPCPPVTLISAFDGADPGLLDTLRGHLATPWPAPRQLVLCTAEDNDAGVALINQLLAEVVQGRRGDDAPPNAPPNAPANAPAEGEPAVVGSITVQSALSTFGELPPGASRKTWHLDRGLALAAHDVVVTVDSTARFSAEAFSDLVASLLVAPERGAAWAPYATDRLGGLGTRLQHLLFAATTYSFVVVDAVRTTLKAPPLLAGGLVAWRRAALDAIGGFGPFADHLAEDIPMAKALVSEGWHVHRSALPLLRHLPADSPADVARRLTRWNLAMLRFREPMRWHYPLVQAPLPLALLSGAAALASAPQDTATILVLFAALVAVRVAWSTWLLRVASRQPFTADVLWLLPLLEALMLGAFLRAVTTRRMRWRGREFDLLPGGRMRARDDS